VLTPYFRTVRAASERRRDMFCQTKSCRKGKKDGGRGIQNRGGNLRLHERGRRNTMTNKIHFRRGWWERGVQQHRGRVGRHREREEEEGELQKEAASAEYGSR
jgi:hypothetical protein